VTSLASPNENGLLYGAIRTSLPVCPFLFHSSILEFTLCPTSTHTHTHIGFCNCSTQCISHLTTKRGEPRISNEIKPTTYYSNHLRQTQTRTLYQKIKKSKNHKTSNQHHYSHKNAFHHKIDKNGPQDLRQDLQAVKATQEESKTTNTLYPMEPSRP